MKNSNTVKTATKAKQAVNQIDGRQVIKAHQRNGGGVTAQEWAQRKFPQVTDGKGNVIQPAMTGAQMDALKERIIANHEAGDLSVQLRKWLEAHPTGDYSNMLPARVDVLMFAGDWWEIMDIAKEEGWSLDEAVSELLYSGLQRHPIEKIKEKHRAEFEKAQKAKK